MVGILILIGAIVLYGLIYVLSKTYLWYQIAILFCLGNDFLFTTEVGNLFYVLVFQYIISAVLPAILILKWEGSSNSQNNSWVFNVYCGLLIVLFGWYIYVTIPLQPLMTPFSFWGSQLTHLIMIAGSIFCIAKHKKLVRDFSK